jgi:ABC-type sugar transport system substrate-binding protein
MNVLRRCTGALAVAAATLLFANIALAAEYDDGLSISYYQKLKGKKVAFVPISMGFDLTQGWLAAMKRQADELGYEIIVRDPNWNIDAGAQALSQLIDEKPDILIFHPVDMQAYNKLIKKAVDAGINVIQMNLKSPNNGDAFVGEDVYQSSAVEADELIRLCSTDKGKNGKVAIIEGVPTGAANVIGQMAIQDKLKGRKDITIVADQAGDWDATKAHSVAATILKQHPDLCGFIGNWDNEDVGTAAAVKEAGLQGKVALVTKGGGNQAAGCDNIANGNFTSYVKWDVRGQARDLNNVIKILLQTKPKPGSSPFALYTPLEILNKDNLHPNSCWTLDEIKQGG